MKIQGDLNWDCHIEELKKKLKQRIGLLKRLRHVIPKNVLRLAAEAIFTSKLRYGIASYLCPKLKDEPGSNATLKELTVIQNDMLRAITGKKLSDHKTLYYGTDPLLYVMCEEDEYYGFHIGPKIIKDCY